MTFQIFSKSYVLALVVATVLLSPSFASAGDGLGRKMQEWLCAIRVGIAGVEIHRPRYFPKDLEDVHPKVREWLKTREVSAQKHVQVNDRDLPTILILGDGSEGEVFLVQTADGLRIAKVAKSHQTYLTLVEAHTNPHGSLPRLLEVDTARLTLLLEYYEGVPVGDIGGSFAPERHRHVNTLWRAWLLNPARTSRYNYNSIYSFREDRIFPIDAR